MADENTNAKGGNDILSSVINAQIKKKNEAAKGKLAKLYEDLEKATQVREGILTQMEEVLTESGMSASQIKAALSSL